MENVFLFTFQTFFVFPLLLLLISWPQSELCKHKGRYICLIKCIISEETVQYSHSILGGQQMNLSLQPLLKKPNINLSINSAMWRVCNMFYGKRLSEDQLEVFTVILGSLL